MIKDFGIFVPARLNSQRLPNKQILPIGDTCMFEICCEKLNFITKAYNIPTYVLICDEELLRIEVKYPYVDIIKRDIGTVEAEGPLQYIYKDILDVPEKYLMFLNPCLIFLDTNTIISKIQEFLRSGKEYGTSVKPFQNWLWYNNLTLPKPIQTSAINFKRLTTKEVLNYYQAAHCFHIFNKELFKEDGYMLKEDLCLLEIPAEKTIDIDTQEDYEYAKWKYEKNNI